MCLVQSQNSNYMNHRITKIIQTHIQSINNNNKRKQNIIKQNTQYAIYMKMNEIAYRPFYSV